VKKSADDRKLTVNRPRGYDGLSKRMVGAKSTSGEHFSDKQPKEAGLTFPWGRLSALETLQSSRAQAYLRWLNDQQELAPDRFLRLLARVVDNKPHRTKRSYQLNRLRRKRRWI